MRVLLALIFLISWSSQTLAQGHKKIRVVTSEYPPYQGQALPKGGIFDNLALVVLREAGYQVDLVYRPWMRAMKEAREGEADAILGLWESAERKLQFEYSPALIENSLVFICRQDKPFCKNSPNLKGKRLGLVLGYAYPELKNFQAITEFELTEDVNLKKLLGGRIDFSLVDRGVAYYLLQQQDPQSKTKVKILEPALEVQNLHIGFSKYSFMGLAAAIEVPKTLKRLEAEGKLKPLRDEANKRGVRIFKF